MLCLATFGCASVPRPQLTADERRADIEYMAEWARKNSPMVELAEQYEGQGYETLLPTYLEYAEQAGSDEAFLRVAQAYGNEICPLGHHYLIGESMITWVKIGIMLGAIDIGIDPSSASEARSWARLNSSNPLCAHPPFGIVRTGEDYFTDREWESEAGIVPKGAQIIRVNDMSCASYLDYLEKETFLRYRTDKENVREKLLIISEGAAFTGWRIDFLLPDNSTMHAFVPKIPVCPGYRFWTEPEENCTCIELTDDIGYIRIKNMHSGMLSYVFSGLHNKDRKIIRQFLNKANGKYRKLIIDVRNNSGGSPAYVYRNLIQPFLDQPVTYTQVAGIKRAYKDKLKPSELKSLRRMCSNENAHVINTKEIQAPEGFDNEDWVFYRLTRRIEPDNRYNFDGSLYVLVDKGTFSAADDFANAVKRIGYARLVGQNTGGGSAAYIIPPALKLPNSSMIFRVETEIVINPDGSINELVGTPPDVTLPYADPPKSISKADLLKDEWIKYIIHNP